MKELLGGFQSVTRIEDYIGYALPRSLRITDSRKRAISLMRQALLLTLITLLLSCDGSPDFSSQRCGAFVRLPLTSSLMPTRLAVVGVSPRFDTGRIHMLSRDGLSLRALPIEATGDTIIRSLGPALALLHRAIGNQDNLTLYDADSGAVCQVPLVAESEAAATRTRPYVNAHDVVALDDGTLYVARHNLPSLAIVDVALGAVVRTIDLTPWQGRAALPYPDALAWVNGEVWVTLERDDDPLRQHPTQRGLVVRIDPHTRRIVGTIELQNANPSGPMRFSADGRHILISTFGSYNVIGDGAVEAIDPTDGRVVELVREDELHGNVDAFDVVDATHLVLRVSAEREGTSGIERLSVVLFDIATHSPPRLLLEAQQWGAAGPVVVGDRIFVSDPGVGAYHTNAGLRVYSLDGALLRPRPIALEPGLMPYDVQPVP